MGACACVLLSASYAAAQVKIGYRSNSIEAPNATLLQLSVDTANKQTDSSGGRGFILPRMKSSVRAAMNGVPEGMLVFDTDSARLALYTKTNPGNRSGNNSLAWKFFSYSDDSGQYIKFLHVDSSEFVKPANGGSTFPKEDGSVDTVVVLKTKKPRQVSRVTPFVKEGASANSSGSDYPRTRISYGGFVLKPGVDYKVEVVTRTGSSSGSGDNKCVKITFLTIVPENWGDFDEFLIEYMLS